MRIYTYHSSQTTPPAELDFASKRRAAFAREAVFEEFSPRAARALDYDGFEDHKPHEGPRLIGEVATTVTRQSGTASFRHWLNQAGQANTDEERAADLRIARNIARAAGVTHADLIGREAA
jgi:hypothetical protein